jgi:hypothetical protein
VRVPIDELVRKLLATQPTSVKLATCLHQQSLRHDVERAGFDADTRMKQATIAGLGVKGCHAAHVMSHYWKEPIDQIDWEVQAIRLLIEAVGDFARTPLPFRSETRDG